MESWAARRSVKKTAAAGGRPARHIEAVLDGYRHAMQGSMKFASGIWDCFGRLGLGAIALVCEKCGRTHSASDYVFDLAQVRIKQFDRR